MNLYKKSSNERVCMMKITLLLAGCTAKVLADSLKIIENVLLELDIKIHKIELADLEYFNGNKSIQSESIMANIKESKGVIAITSVPLITMHAAMQSFFDMASLYDDRDFDIPLLAVSYSDSIGEQEVANTMLRCWSALGGKEGGKISLNNQVDIKYVADMLEREIEDFYRVVKQQRVTIKSSEYMMLKTIKNGDLGSNSITAKLPYKDGLEPCFEKKDKDDTRNNKAEDNYQSVRSLTDIIKNDLKDDEINTSNKAKAIKEITSKIRNKNDKSNTSDSTFKEFGAGVYKKPVGTNVNTRKVKKVEQIPHYFVAQHEVELELVLKYSITNNDQIAYIVIKDGDCIYSEKAEEAITVELILSEEVLDDIISKKITYQKAFMLGKLKVKGNFAVLPTIDKIFK